MTGGSSGGPWFKDFTGNGAGGTVTSLNSYGYGKQPNMYGPKFNSDDPGRHRTPRGRPRPDDRTSDRIAP